MYNYQNLNNIIYYRSFYSIMSNDQTDNKLDERADKIVQSVTNGISYVLKYLYKSCFIDLTKDSTSIQNYDCVIS